MVVHYPSLLQTANDIDSHSWFDIKERRYTGCRKKKKKRLIEYKYVETKKIVIHFTDKQKDIINKWLDDCIDIYNLTNKYMKDNLTNKNIKTFPNFYKIRASLKNNISDICHKNGLTKHTADYSVKHCIEMYKSAISNHLNIDKFEIRDLLKTRKRKNLIIEPAAISKKINSFFTKTLGKIDTNINLNIIKQNSILQYDRFKKSYIIITPINISRQNEVNQYTKCGIDIGVRNFLTTYSEPESYEIGTDTYGLIDRTNKRLDGIRKSKDNNIINEKMFEKLYNKYSMRLRNSINDMHNKAANFLLSRYRTIIIGKVSIKKMISNLTGNLKEITKRRLMALSHYRFRMKLKQMAVIYGNKIIETNEYLTSKTCSKCNNTKDDLGGNKIYKCKKCKLKIDRDLNAAINIYGGRMLTRSHPVKRDSAL